jgi:tRNA (guanine37-N1)-methyltransferase
MKFDVISIFPEFFDSPLSCGVIRIAQEKGVMCIAITNPRNFSKQGTVDDYQFGGGAGMVMKPEPLTEAIDHVRSKNSILIHLTPRGQRLSQQMVVRLTREEHIVLICGRYKGIDERLQRIHHPLEISIGDYILAGGEIGALVVIESIARLLPGVLGNSDSADTDSFQQNLLESPIYTRPHTYKKYKVPRILRGGDHRRIADWRRKKSLEETLSRRPDIMSAETYSKKDLEILVEVLHGKNSRN